MPIGRHRAAPPEPVERADTGLAVLQLYAEDGAEEPLLPPPAKEHVAAETRIKLALRPGARWVSLRAVARSRHATVTIYRADESASPQM